jgi:hypothetical protein
MRKPDQRTPEGAGHRRGARRIEKLVELDATILVLHGDHRVAKLEQIFLVHGEQLLPHGLSLRLGGKGNHDEFAHLTSLLCES